MFNRLICPNSMLGILDKLPSNGKDMEKREDPQNLE
jgi:hypothetical protein